MESAKPSDDLEKQDAILSDNAGHLEAVSVACNLSTPHNENPFDNPAGTQLHSPTNLYGDPTFIPGEPHRLSDVQRQPVAEGTSSTFPTTVIYTSSDTKEIIMSPGGSANPTNNFSIGKP